MVLKKVRNIIKWVVVLFFSTTILAVVAYRFIPVYLTPLMIIRCFQQVADGESITLHHHWVSRASAFMWVMSRRIRRGVFWWVRTR